MIRVAIDIDCSSPLHNHKLDVIARLGVPAKSITIVQIPSGVQLLLNWTGTPITVDESDVIEEPVSELYVTTVGTSASPIKLVVSDTQTFWRRLSIVRAARYCAVPPVYTDQSLAYLLTDVAGRLISKLAPPVQKGLIFNTALPAAEADLFTADLTPSFPPALFRIHVTVSVSGILRIARIRSGTTVTENLNSSVALESNAAHVFDIAVADGDSINLRYSVTGGNVLYLVVQEIPGGA